MPELPEVEVSRQGILPHLKNKRLKDAIVRIPRLRHDIPADLPEKIKNRVLNGVYRRGKYLLFDFESQAGGGWLILHLGMSGSLRLVKAGAPLQKHDHIDLVFPNTTLRFRDPRRFGTLIWIAGNSYANHPLIAVMGIEPLEDEFTGKWLYDNTRKRQTPIKTLIMDSHFVVGVGNIYACESLFKANIRPTKPAAKLSLKACEKLVCVIRQTLQEAIACGGSSIRDYVHSDGGAGSFQLNNTVYGREGLPCPTCHRPIKKTTMGGRGTFYCAHCQR